MTDPIVDAVCAKLQSRSAVGLKKYGTTLADNVATVKEKLTHIQEELMDGANYVEWLLQEKEMPTPMTIEMEAQVKADIKELSMAAGIADTFHGRNCCAALDRIEAALLTKPTENVTCENLSNTDERQAALDALNRLHAYSDYYGCSQDFKTVSAALQSPRVPVIEILETVLEQAEDEGLWFNAKYASEAYLQQELRRLHAVIERAYAELQKGV